MNTTPILEDLEYICKLMYDSFKVPICFLDKQGEIVFECSSHFVHNPLYLSKQEVWKQLFNPDGPHQFPVLRTTRYLESFVSICVKVDDAFKGTVIMGPAISLEPSDEIIKGMINDFNLNKEKHEMVHYYQSLPILSNLKLIQASMHLYYMIYRKKLDTTTILQQNKLLEQTPIEIENADVSVSQRRQTISFHTDPIYEKKLFQCIKEGRKEELIESLKRLPEQGELGVLSKSSHLRSQKNLAISAITLGTRSAMEGGLHPEIAYTLSDLYIRNLEELQDSRAVNTLLEDALCDFAERVQQNQNQQYSKPINLCQSYIFTHLYEDITLSTLADIVSLNPRYLSGLFKKEVGISVSEYIQHARIEEAKNLITFTNHSLSEICTMLNFHDQSYFTKVFKRFTGVTPKQFKGKHIVY